MLTLQAQLRVEGASLSGAQRRRAALLDAVAIAGAPSGVAVVSLSASAILLAAPLRVATRPVAPSPPPPAARRRTCAANHVPTQPPTGRRARRSLVGMRCST